MNSLKTSPNNLRNIAPLQPVLLALILLLGGCECHIKGPRIESSSSRSSTSEVTTGLYNLSKEEIARKDAELLSKIEEARNKEDYETVGKLLNELMQLRAGMQTETTKHVKQHTQVNGQTVKHEDYTVHCVGGVCDTIYNDSNEE